MFKGLKERLGNFEEEFNSKIEEVSKLEEEETKRKLKEEVASNIITKKDPIISINIGGKIFKCSYSVLTSFKGSLFSELYKDKAHVNEVFFIDRGYDFFHIVLNFIRSRVFDVKDYTRQEIQDIKEEAEFYVISDLISICDEILTKVEFVSFTSSAKYSSCGTHKLEDLLTKDLNTGICVQSPYYIIIELNFEHEFDKIEIAGFTGNSGSWAASNGCNATILTSTDNTNWKDVGKLPANYGGTIQKVEIKKSVAKYIKFQHNTYLGIGYLNIVKN